MATNYCEAQVWMYSIAGPRRSCDENRPEDAANALTVTVPAPVSIA